MQTQLANAARTILPAVGLHDATSHCNVVSAKHVKNFYNKILMSKLAKDYVYAGTVEGAGVTGS